MGQVHTSRFQRALDAVEQLSPEDQEALMDVVRQRLAIQRREEIARHASETLSAVREGRACYGSVDDLKEDLLSDA